MGIRKDAIRQGRLTHLPLSGDAAIFEDRVPAMRREVVVRVVREIAVNDVLAIIERTRTLRLVCNESAIRDQQCIHTGLGTDRPADEGRGIPPELAIVNSRNRNRRMDGPAFRIRS